jgi:hypothetical protein
MLVAGTSGCGGSIPDPEIDSAEESLGDQARRGGAFTCEIEIDRAMFDSGLVNPPPILERDRMYTMDRPGVRSAHIAVSIPPAGNLRSGNRYLFDSFDAARRFKRFLEREYDLGGVLFFDREEFVRPDCHVWELLQQASFAPVESQKATRMERLKVRPGQRAAFEARFAAIAETARASGLTSVWLLYSEREQLAALVSFDDEPSVDAIASRPPLRWLLGDLGHELDLDMSHHTLAIFSPFAPGDRGPASIWPNSPPYPQPGPGDGVCEVSRGENAASSGGDCPATCGDGVAQDGETWVNCPGDVRLFR